MNNPILFVCTGFAMLLISVSVKAVSAQSKVETCIDIAPVWSGHPVGFCLYTNKDRQYVAFYNAERKMTVGVRKLNESKWHFIQLPETLGWDSHNYVTMTIDDDGCLHLSGNMHAGPLRYYRTAKPGDIDTFERIPAMTGRDEERTTYPRFMRGPNNELLFVYRSGYSGNGDEIYNRYDHKTKTWQRLMDGPLTSGEGQMNAYFSNLLRGKDSYYHLCWVWRDHGGCETNHDLSYARSRDLIHWETSSGKPLTLPITLKTGEIVDPVPVKGGIINGNTRLGFDSKSRPVISYHKFDEKGITQAYNARLEDGQWKIYQTSHWDYRWYFQGGGSIPFEIRIGPVQVESSGQLTQTFSHIKYGSGKWVLDEAVLKPVSETITASAPGSGDKEADPNSLQSRSAGDSGPGGEPGVRYVLRWETLGPNRDKPREGPPPPPSMLRLCEIR